MKRNNLLIPTLLIYFLMLGSSYASYSSLSEGSNPTIYDKEGPFVEIPAKVGDNIFFYSGMTVGMIFGLIVSPFRGLGATPKKFDPIESMNMWKILGFATAPVGYYIFGAPFYTVKKVFYDGPKKLLGIGDGVKIVK